MSSRRRRFALEALSWLAIAAPFLPFLLGLPHFGTLQRNDYWGDFHDILEPDGSLTRHPLRWLTARSNEHPIGALLPIWLLNARLTGGDNRALALLSFALLVLGFGLLYRRLPPEVRQRPGLRAAHAVPLAVLVATPEAAHNWVMGFSGNQWFLANTLAIAAFVLLTRFTPDRLRDLAAPAGVLLLASFVHSTHLGIALALVVGTLLQPASRRVRIGAVALLLVALLAYASNFRHRTDQAPPNRSPSRITTFVCEYVGGAVSPDLPVARVWGAAAILLFVAALVRLRRVTLQDERRAVLLWLLVALFGLVAAFGTAIGRGNYREGIAADTSRYATLQNLVWLGAGMSWALLLRFAPPARPRLRAAWLVLGVAGAALVGSNYRIGWDRLEKHLAKVRWQPVASIAMRWQIDDPQIVETVSPRLPWPELPLFRRLHHIPFDRWPEGEPGTRRTDAIDSTVDPAASGQWLALQRLPGAHDRVVGSFARAVPRDSLVLFLDAGQILRGAAAATPPRVGVASTLLGQADGALEWTGYLDRRFATTARPYLALPAGGPLLPLAGTPAGLTPSRQRSERSGL